MLRTLILGFLGCLLLCSCTRSPNVPLVAQNEASEDIAPVEEPQLLEPQYDWAYGNFDAGKAFFDQMLQENVAPNKVQEIVDTLTPVYDFRKSQASHRWGLGRLDGELTAFSLDVSPILSYSLVFGENGAELNRLEMPLKVVPEVIRGEIESSLFGALQHEPHGPLLAMKLAKVFAWDIDFYQDPRKGDQLEILVERQYIETDDGLVFFEYGELLAARYITKRSTYDAYLFEDEDGDPAYFNAKGQSLIRDVLRSPLKFQRITSKFTHRRFHPILKKNRPHRGVDYGAPTNTPVMAVAKGKVKSAGRNGGAGIAVEIRHRGEMVTQYFHLNKIAKGVRAGQKVRQGQVIGYVGQTGYATAPHLHFGMKIRGSYVDPMKQKFEPGRPVAQARMPEFLAMVDTLSQPFEGTNRSQPAQVVQKSSNKSAR